MQRQRWRKQPDAACGTRTNWAPRRRALPDLDTMLSLAARADRQHDRQELEVDDGELRDRIQEISSQLAEAHEDNRVLINENQALREENQALREENQTLRKNFQELIDRNAAALTANSSATQHPEAPAEQLLGGLLSIDFAARVPRTSSAKAILQVLQDDEQVEAMTQRLHSLDDWRLLQNVVSALVTTHLQTGHRFRHTETLIGLAISMRGIRNAFSEQFIKELADLAETIEFGDAGAVAKEMLYDRFVATGKA